jgi:hypothetical protein
LCSKVSGKGWVVVRDPRGRKFKVRTNQCSGFGSSSSSNGTSSSSSSGITSGNTSTSGATTPPPGNGPLSLPPRSTTGAPLVVAAFEAHAAPAPSARPEHRTSVEAVGGDGQVEKVGTSQAEAAKYFEVWSSEELEEEQEEEEEKPILIASPRDPGRLLLPA